MGAGISGIGNVIAKDTKGNIYNFYGFSYEQIKYIITSSTALPSQTYETPSNTNRELQNVTETKQHACRTRTFRVRAGFGTWDFEGVMSKSMVLTLLLS